MSGLTAALWISLSVYPAFADQDSHRKAAVDLLMSMTTFYKTPTGQKAITKLPVLTQKGARWGQKQVTDNIDELKGLIADESRRLEKLKTPSPESD